MWKQTVLWFCVGFNDDNFILNIFLWRYELPAPSSGQKNDITAWQECVNNSMAQLEHQAVRIENLELMSQYGTNAWKVYNEYVTGDHQYPHPSIHLEMHYCTLQTHSIWKFLCCFVFFSNLAFMIEMAQKELQKFRWPITGISPARFINSSNHSCLTIVFFVHRKQIQDLNWQRKNDQLGGGAKLRELESKWVVWKLCFLYDLAKGICKILLHVPFSTAGCRWSVRTMRLRGPSFSWRMKSLSWGNSRGTRTRRTSDRTSRTAAFTRTTGLNLWSLRRFPSSLTELRSNMLTESYLCGACVMWRNTFKWDCNLITTRLLCGWYCFSILDF